MSINSVIVSGILMQYNAEYIANVFWKQNIAQVSSITLLPYLQGTKVYQTAYVSIATWCDSEVAYNFIKRLKGILKKARIVHQSDYWWSIKINTHNSGNIFLGPYTTTFPETFFKKLEEEKVLIDYSIKNRALIETILASDDKIIQYYTNPDMYMSVKESHTRLDFLKKIVPRYSPRDPLSLLTVKDIKDEIEFIEEQLFSIVSKNVTLRPHQMSFAI